MKVIEGRPLRGVVLDGDAGTPVAGSPVGLYGPARPQVGAAVQVNKSDADGGFVFQVPPGENYVYLMDVLSNRRSSRRTLIVPEEGEVEIVRLVGVPRPERPSMVMMKTEARPAPKMMARGGATPVNGARADDPAAAPAPEARTLTGRVLDARGVPLVGIQVYVNPAMPVADARLAKVGSAATDREGVFLLPGLPPRPLEICIHKPGYQIQAEALPPDRDGIEWIYRLEPDPSARSEPAPRGDDPIPEELRGRLAFVGLDRVGTDTLAEGPAENGNDLNRLTRGVRRMDDLFFRIGERMVHVQGQARPELPREVKGIAVGARGRLLHVLHAAQGGAPPGTEVGAYVVHYDDGSTARIPLVYGREIVNWFQWDRPGFRDVPTVGRIVSDGSNDTTDLNAGMKIRLIAFSWANPHPEKGIATVDVISHATACDLFLVALTVERPE